MGRKKWKQRFNKEPLEGFVSTTDEAFAIWCVENTLDICKSEATDETLNDDGREKADGRHKKKADRGTKWTSAGTSTADGDGVTEDGVRRFNDLLRMVRQDRRERGAEFDRWFLEQNPAESEDPQRKRRKTSAAEVSVLEAENDLDDYANYAEI